MDLEEAPSDSKQLGDCLILLAGLAEMAGIDLLAAAEAKFAEIQARECAPPETEGGGEQIRDDDVGFDAFYLLRFLALDPTAKSLNWSETELNQFDVLEQRGFLHGWRVNDRGWAALSAKEPLLEWGSKGFVRRRPKNGGENE